MAENRTGSEPLSGHFKYEKIKDLSAGAFGFVQLARNKRSGTLVAIKFLDRSQSRNSKHVVREVVAHSNFCHPHVIQFKEVFLTRDHLAIVMEYAAGGDLFHYVKQREGLPEDTARWFFQQLIVGLDYCHRMGVVNRDIKLENTLLDGSPRPLVKITDFGYCKTNKDSSPKTILGTPGYTAPEIIMGKPQYDGERTDIWSAGVMLYVMLFCAYPFERDDDDKRPDGAHRVLQRIGRADYRIPASPVVTPECKDLLARILVVDPDRRATVADIQKHPWYTRGLPPAVLTMNDECIRLRPHSHPGYQTIEQIKAVVDAC